MNRLRRLHPPPPLRLLSRHESSAHRPRKPAADASPTTPAATPAHARQAFPLHGFYLDILNNPLTPAHSAAPRGPDAQEGEREARARVVFGSRLAGPGSEALRQRRKREHGRVVAGVWVPPRPVEPDNCCMSGCVNCVLSQFVEDLDEWRRAKRAAEERLRAHDGAGVAGADEGLWVGFEDIPVGLRVFMETEKRLKEKEKEKEKERERAKEKETEKDKA